MNAGVIRAFRFSELRMVNIHVNEDLFESLILTCWSSFLHIVLIRRINIAGLCTL